jgi:DNA invertase Pin-like site-specific DNA recombinase
MVSAADPEAQAGQGFQLDRNHRHVVYYRVSTTRQAGSGLGLEAQRAAVSRYLAGLDAPLAEFVEVESGKRSDRPELAKAMRHAQATGATLLVAKLDRLSRDAHFLLGLQKAGVRFVAVDMPAANSLTVGLLAVVAQHEREMISRRTREALAAAKARGQRLGSPKAKETIARVSRPDLGWAAVRENARARADGLRWVLEELEATGVTSNSGIARSLNAKGIQAPRGGRWTATGVKRLRERLMEGS